MRVQGIRIQNQKQLQMHKSQCRNTKQQGNSSPSKANSTNKDVSNSKDGEMLNIELKNSHPL
jgi:hypothetical protein